MTDFEHNDDIHNNIHNDTQNDKLTINENSVAVMVPHLGAYVGYTPCVDHMGSDTVRRMLDGTKLLTGPNGKFELNPSDESTHYVINRLVMICVVECMVCNKRQTEECNQLIVGRQWGWLYCDDCLKSGRLRATILGWINKEKTIPCTWISKSQTFTKPDDDDEKSETAYYLNFFRYSQRDTIKPVYKGRTYPYDDNGSKIRFMKDDVNGYGMSITFTDHVSGHCMERFVSLENIFAHNPQFYKELTSCADLLNREDLKIGYSDISQELRASIDHSYGLSLVHDSMSYRY